MSQYDIPISAAGQRALEEHEAAREREYAPKIAPDWQAAELRKLRSELAELRHQVKELQRFKKAVIPAVGDALGQVRREIEQQIPKWRGVYSAGHKYLPNDQVTRSGSLWICLAETTTAPGSSSAWVLAVKSNQRSGD
jgi:hypothetical protein